MTFLTVSVKCMQLREKPRLSVQEQWVVEEAALHKENLVQKRLFRDLIRELGDFTVDLIYVRMRWTAC